MEGYNPFTDFLAQHPTPLSDFWNSRVSQGLFLDGLSLLASIATFLTEVFVVLVVFVFICAFFYNLFAPLFRDMGKWSP
jgi:hypothetical protein